MVQSPAISIVIRTSNSEKPLRALLAALKLSPQDEVVIVDTGSSDGTLSLAENAGATIVRNARPFHYSHTLNLGFAAARNNWLLSLSAHCVPIRPDFLERYRAALATLPDTTAVVYGLQAFSRRGSARFGKEVAVHAGAVARDSWRGGGNTNALYLRSAWEKHPFSEAIPRGEDGEWRNWALQQGYSCAEAPEACVLYRHDKGPVYRFKKAYADVVTCMSDAPPMSFRQLVLSVVSASRHLLWEDFCGIAWVGEMGHILGTFMAGRQKRRG